MIPMKYLSKIGIYEVDFQGAKVKAILVTNEAILDAKITELRSSLQRQKCSVVGIDFKLYTGKKAELMILCSLNVCLIIKLAKLHSTPYNLKFFLEDKNVCFVGNGIRDKLPSLTLVNELWRISVTQTWIPGISHKHEKPLSISLSGVVEACDLACMVLKKSNLCNSGLAELNKEVRINTVNSTTASSSSCLLPPVSEVKVEKANLHVITCPNWSAVGFSGEEIKYEIHDAYTCCFIGDRLLGMIDASK